MEKYGYPVISKDISDVISGARKGQPYRLARLNGESLDKNGKKSIYNLSLIHISRIAREMGFRKIITYTLAEESGASLRASGWSCVPGFRGGGSWNVPGRPRTESRNTGPKRMYYKELR